jgi:DNA-binding transcriptional LysR family regulator
VAHPLATRAALTLAEIARAPLIVLDRPVAGAYYRDLLTAQPDPVVVAYASSAEMVRSLVGAGRGRAILNMRPVTATTYAGTRVAAIPIVDPLPPLTLAVAHDRARPRRLVHRFAEACLAQIRDPKRHHGVLPRSGA